MRIRISLPDPLAENAKRLAANRGITLSEMIADALRNELARKGSPPEPEFHLFTVNGGFVDPNLDINRTSALIVADDEEYYRGKL